MTQIPLEALPWPTGASSRTRAAALPDALWFAVGVFVVLVFSQGWVMPVTGPDIGPDADPESSGLVRALYTPGYLAALALAWSGRGRLRSLLWRAPLLWPPLLMIALSCLWSIDPSTTERRLVALGFTVLGGLALAARFDWEELVEVFATAFGLLALASLGLGAAKPALGRMTTIFPGAWRGLWYEKNALGDIMTVGAILFAAAAVLRPARRGLWLGAAALALGLIVLSTSKTSLVTLMAGLAVMALVAVARRGGAWTVLGRLPGRHRDRRRRGPGAVRQRQGVRAARQGRHPHRPPPRCGPARCTRPTSGHGPATATAWSGTTRTRGPLAPGSTSTRASRRSTRTTAGSRPIWAKAASAC